jgi:membrane protease YdiL (CAAX protease family)
MLIRMNNSPTLRPLPLAQAALYFGLPALLMLFTFYVGEPYLTAQGLPAFYSSSLALYGPLALLLIAALVAYRLEGRPLSWDALAKRFRFRRLDRAGWLWALALTAWASLVLLNPLSQILVEKGIIPLPAHMPALLDPRMAQDPASAGQSLSGRMPGWIFALLNLAFLLVNVLGEELWWRGYILPRQEAAHGRWAWVVHGVLWTLFHAPKYWQYPTLLPGCLAYAYVSQRTRNIWPAIIAHLVINGMGMASVVIPALVGA